MQSVSIVPPGSWGHTAYDGVMPPNSGNPEAFTLKALSWQGKDYALPRLGTYFLDFLDFVDIHIYPDASHTFDFLVGSLGVNSLKDALMPTLIGELGVCWKGPAGVQVD